MTRPKTYGEIATAVRLPASTQRRLHEATHDRDVSANLLITRAVTEFLDRRLPAQTPFCPPDEETQPGAMKTRA